MLKVFWSRCGHGHGNFGDKLTPLILNYLKVRHIWSPPENADLIGIGSLIEKIPEGFKGGVWTSGMMFDAPKTLSRAQVYAVRGRLTLERLQRPDHTRVQLGDGGLLCHLFYRPVRKKYKLGLIPHFVDVNDPVISGIVSGSREIRLIDICAETNEVIQAVGECEHILSSSLHGLILADSLSIPSEWMELNHGDEVVMGNGFKFRDYFSNFGMPEKRPFKPVASDTLETLLPLFDHAARPGLETMKENLLQSLEALKNLDLHLSQTTNSDHEIWAQGLRETQSLICNLIPPTTPFILVDEDQIRKEISGARAVPFIEKNGEYWGPPVDDETAIRELERLRCSGLKYIAFTPPSFWWMHHYSQFAAYLRSRFTCPIENNVLILFDLDPVHIS